MAARHLLGAVALVALCAASTPAQSRSAAYAVASAAAAPAPGDSTADDSIAAAPPLRILLELRLGHLASRTVQGFRTGNDALLPAGALLELAEVHHHLDASGRLTATLPERKQTITIDHVSNTMWVGDRRIAIGLPHTVLSEGELYIAARALETLLDIHFSVSWPELAVTVDDPDALPLALRLEHEAARQRLLTQPRGLRTPDLAIGLARPDVDGLVLDYSLVAPSDDPLRQGSYDVALGANVLGGSFEGSVSGTAASRRATMSWVGVWDDARIVRQLRLGDARATGPSPRALRGVSIGNAPYLRLTDFGTADFLGNAAPGWLVEAYRGGQLIAFDSTDASGRFGMPLPVEYGENPIDFVAYGPYGETRDLHQLYRIPGALIPADRLEYGASLGACTMLRCQATANLDVRYGLSPRWTARAGLDRFWRDSRSDLSHPYASLAGSLGNAWSVDVFGVADATAQATVRFEPSLGLRLTAQYARYTTDVEDPLLSPAGQRARWAATALLRPLGIRTPFYLDAQAERIEMTTTGTLTRARLGSSLQYGALRLMPYARVERDVSPTGTALTQPFVGVNAFLLPLGPAGSNFGRMWWRAGLETAGLSRLNRLSAVVTSPIGHGVRAELGATWTRGLHGPALTLAFTTDRGSVRSYTTLSAQRGTTPGVTQSLQGSMLVDRSTNSVMFVPGPSMQRAGVAGRVFLDANGNGRRDPGEEALEDVRVRVGTQTVHSDAEGWFRVWDVVPFEPLTVVVDSMSLASPLWVPLFGVTSVVPGPNRFQLVDIPIVPGGTIDGRVQLETGALPTRPGGIHVVLTNLRTRTSRTATTFSDGAFSFLAVAPGRYRVAVDARDLVALHGVARMMEVDVPPEVNGARITGLALTVRSVVAAR